MNKSAINNLWRSGCNVCTKDPENFDEEVKSLVSAWRALHLQVLGQPLFLVPKGDVVLMLNRGSRPGTD